MMRAMTLLLSSVGCCAAAMSANGYPQEDCAESRGADVQTAARLRTTLWPMTVRWYIDPFDTASHDRADPLDADDSRIVEAMAHWQENTCLTFERCTSLDSCAEPVLRFVSQGSGCASPIGMVSSRGNTVDIGPECTVGNIIHEVGHSMGLNHEHRRNDRDEYIEVVWRNVGGTSNTNYAKLGSGGRALGPYDYGSIMHYPAGEWRTAIVAPEPIGQRTHLSAGDLATLSFLYNDCRGDVAAMRCTANRAEAVVHELWSDRGPYWLEFNAKYRTGMTVTLGGSALPLCSTSVPNGAALPADTQVVLQFDAARAAPGEVYSLTARFAADGAACERALSFIVRQATPAPTPAPTPTPPPCDGEWMEAGASIVHPAAAAAYSPNERLCWRVNCAGAVMLTWLRFETEARYDSVRIHDAANALLHQFDGDELPAVHQLAGPLTLEFRSDSSVQKKGFRVDVACSAAGTPAPAAATPAPPTPAPATPLPATPAPQTPAPATPLPATPAPQTPLPSTPEPSPTEEAAVDPSPCTSYEVDTSEAAGVVELRNYDANERKCWRVRCGSTVALTWELFDTELNFDFLYVYSHAAPAGQRFHGRQAPALSAVDGTMVVRFTSDRSVQRSGFALRWRCGAAPTTAAPLPTTTAPTTTTTTTAPTTTTTLAPPAPPAGVLPDPCASYVVDATASSGTLRLPLDEAQEEYDLNFEACFRIRCATVLQLEWRRFDVERSFDWLYLYPQDAPRVALTGYSLPAETNFAGSLALRFTSDSSQTYDGFVLDWTCVQ